MQFFHHGEIAADGRNVVVCTRKDQLVPTRILQLGPGDFCRLAFQTIPGQDAVRDSLRRHAAREADRAAVDLQGRAAAGDAAVQGLQPQQPRFGPRGVRVGQALSAPTTSTTSTTASNPFSLGAEPFLSRYTRQAAHHVGRHLRLPHLQPGLQLPADRRQAGDRRARAARPGARRPARQPQGRQLRPGVHKFEYYHAAAGPSAMMVAAWEVESAGRQAQAGRHSDRRSSQQDGRARRSAGPVTLRDVEGRGARLPRGHRRRRAAARQPECRWWRAVPRHFAQEPGACTSKIHWDFGDGQTSERPTRLHVYLRPGLYTVKLSLPPRAEQAGRDRQPRRDRPADAHGEGQGEVPHAGHYLPILQTYDAAKLDAGGCGSWWRPTRPRSRRSRPSPRRRPRRRSTLPWRSRRAKAAFLDESAAAAAATKTC